MKHLRIKSTHTSVHLPSHTTDSITPIVLEMTKARAQITYRYLEIKITNWLVRSPPPSHSTLIFPSPIRYGVSACDDHYPSCPLKQGWYGPLPYYGTSGIHRAINMPLFTPLLNRGNWYGCISIQRWESSASNVRVVQVFNWRYTAILK